MAATYTLISSNVLSSNTASVTFSSIPSTYTDLVLRMSTRLDAALNNNPTGIRINGLSTTIYSSTGLASNGSAPSSLNAASTTQLELNTAQGSLYTANTFTSVEFYFPNYTVSANKAISGISHSENNATSALTRATANLIRNTDSITSINIFDLNSYNFVAGSSFYLYGIKNS